jgi:hypothetical protein
MADTKKKSSKTTAAAARAKSIIFDESTAVELYSNFSYTGGTQNGLLLGFGFHDWIQDNPVRVGAKLELSFHNTKKLLSTLSQVIENHENAFGKIQMDAVMRLQKKK